MRRYLIAVIGDASAREGSQAYETARECGRRVVDSGHRVLCGGLGGIMEAAARGAHDSPRYRDGDTLGLLPGFDPADANEWVDIAIPTGLGHLRNGLVGAADATIAIGGGAGTLSEIAFAWMHRRPVVAFAGAGGWAAELAGRALDGRHAQLGEALATVRGARTAAECVEQAIAAAAQPRRPGGVGRGGRRS